MRRPVDVRSRRGGAEASTDQLEERRGDQGGKDTDGHGQPRDWQHAARRREIAEVIERPAACMVSHIFECNIRRGAALAGVQPPVLARDEATCDARYLRMPPCAAESQGDEPPTRRIRAGPAWRPTKVKPAFAFGQKTDARRLPPVTPKPG